MDPHIINLPRKVIVGNNVIDNIFDICSELEVKKPLILADKNTIKISGEKIKENLIALNPQTEIVKEASRAEIERIKNKVKGIDTVIGTGGGVVIDVAKVVAFEKNACFFSVPTAPSHDGIVSETASITKNGRKTSIKTQAPRAIIADVNIISNAPYRLIASGCGDIISNLTAVYDWKLARKNGEYFSEYAASLSLLAADIVMKSADAIVERKERGIRNLIEALITSGIAMSIAQSSRPASGSEHIISHALDMMNSNALHGEQCGIASIGIAYLQGQDWKKIKQTLQKIKAPVSFREMGIEKEMVVKAFLEGKTITKRERYTILDEKPLTRDKVEQILRVTGIY